MNDKLPVGKLPHDLLSELLADAPVSDPRVLLGPGIGLDCAVIDLGATLLVLKTDPITFATEDIGWYLVQVNANDIATTGAIPRWLMVTALLPEGLTTMESARAIAQHIFEACRPLGISVIGGHTEITFGIDRPILSGTIIGEVERDKLVLPNGARPGDKLLLTKGIPIEATAILAREFSHQLSTVLSPAEMQEAQNYLYQPGISILRDAQLALAAGNVTAMHDPTEGGLATALWELAEASRCSLILEPSSVFIPQISARMCNFFHLNPCAAIASGALLMAVDPLSTQRIIAALHKEGISCAEIGWVEEGPVRVWQQIAAERQPLPRPERDEIARLFEQRDLDAL
jgi:hydrogenase expression/formation protein HypE